MDGILVANKDNYGGMIVDYSKLPDDSESFAISLKSNFALMSL
jgi:hypothetical protein